MGQVVSGNLGYIRDMLPQRAVKLVCHGNPSRNRVIELSAVFATVMSQVPQANGGAAGC